MVDLDPVSVDGASIKVEASPSEQLSSELGKAMNNASFSKENGDGSINTTTQVAEKATEDPQTPIETGEPAPATDDGSKGTQENIASRSNGDHGGRGSYRGRGQNGGKHFQKYPKINNAKSDLTSQPESSDPNEIRKQVEFYFADSNLPLDKFLFEKVQGHKNLPVPLQTIHSFKRMRHFQPFSAIVDALKESTVLELVDDNTAVRRKVPIAEELCGDLGEIQKVWTDKTMPQSVYVKGFGEEQLTTQFDLENFFAEFGSVNAVRLRRTYDKTFKGSVFVEFKDEETASAFLKLDPQPKWNGKDLLIKGKRQYCDEKADEINAKRAKGSANMDNWRTRKEQDQKHGSNRGGRGGRDSGGRGGRGRSGGQRPNRGENSKRGGRYNQVDNRGVPKVTATNEDPPAKGEKAEVIDKDTSTAQDATEPSKKRLYEADDSSETQNDAKREKLVEEKDS